MSKIEKIEEAAKLAGLKTDDFINFFLIRGYIRKEGNGYSATVLGFQRECFVEHKGKTYITIEGMQRVSNAFAA